MSYPNDKDSSDPKKDTSHVEVLQSASGIDLKETAFYEAQQDALSEGRPKLQIIRENLKTCAVIIATQTNGIILGLEYTLLGALVGTQSFCKTMGHYDATTKSYAVAASTLSLWGGLFGLMQFLGQMFVGWFADRFGRRKAIYLMVFNVYIGVMTEILSRNKWDYLGAKIIMGSATGMMQVVIPTYVAEITPREIRGISIGLFSFNLSLGSLVGTFVTWGANQAFGGSALDNRAWKVPLYVGLASPTLTLIAMLFLVSESPYWLILKNRPADASRSLQSLHPSKSAEEIERITHELQYTVLKEREHHDLAKDASYMECLRGANLRRTFCALMPSLCQQLIGNQLVQSYSTYFFTLANLSNALLGSVIVSIVGLFAAVIAFFLIELKSVGRWPLVFFGACGISLSMLGIGIVDSADHGHTTKSTGALLVMFIALFNACTAIGPGVAGWSYAGESGSARLRAKTATLATGANAIIGTITNIVIPYELVAIGPKTGYMFFGIGIICCYSIYKYIPEVGGRTYAQLDELFERRIPARQFKTTHCSGQYSSGASNNLEAEV